MTELTGGCLCGAVRYRIAAEPVVVTHCHCTFCRRAAGAAFVTWITIASEGFAWTEGEPLEYRSSAEALRGFCGACGTSLSYRGDSHPEEIDIAAASLDDPERVTPQDHIWVGSMVSWLKFDDGLPRLEGSHWQQGYPENE